MTDVRRQLGLLDAKMIKVDSIGGQLVNAVLND
jgi:hypothetical protein